METIQRADPKARRKAIRVTCVATVVGVAAILGFDQAREAIQSWLLEHIDFVLEHPIVVLLGAFIFASPILAAGIYCFLFGNRVVRAQRFPPPGYAVVRDTPILQGRQGVWRGRIIQFISLLLLCSAAAIPFILWYLFRSLGSTK